MEREIEKGYFDIVSTINGKCYRSMRGFGSFYADEEERFDLDLEDLHLFGLLSSLRTTEEDLERLSTQTRVILSTLFRVIPEDPAPQRFACWVEMLRAWLLVIAKQLPAVRESILSASWDANSLVLRVLEDLASDAVLSDEASVFASHVGVMRDLLTQDVPSDRAVLYLDLPSIPQLLKESKWGQCSERGLVACLAFCQLDFQLEQGTAVLISDGFTVLWRCGGGSENWRISHQLVVEIEGDRIRSRVARDRFETIWSHFREFGSSNFQKPFVSSDWEFNIEIDQVGGAKSRVKIEVLDDGEGPVVVGEAEVWRVTRFFRQIASIMASRLIPSSPEWEDESVHVNRRTLMECLNWNPDSKGTVRLDLELFGALGITCEVARETLIVALNKFKSFLLKKSRKRFESRELDLVLIRDDWPDLWLCYATNSRSPRLGLRFCATDEELLGWADQILNSFGPAAGNES